MLVSQGFSFFHLSAFTFICPPPLSSPRYRCSLSFSLRVVLFNMAASNHVGSVPQNHDTTPLSDSPTGTKAAKEFNIEIRVVEQLENILQTMKTAAQVNPATSEEKDASLQPHTSHHDHLTQIRSRLGLKEEAPLDEEHVHLAHHELLWSRIRYIFKEPFAEFWGYVYI